MRIFRGDIYRFFIVHVVSYVCSQIMFPWIDLPTFIGVSTVFFVVGYLYDRFVGRFTGLFW